MTGGACGCWFLATGWARRKMGTARPAQVSCLTGGPSDALGGPPPRPALEELGDRRVALVFQRLGAHGEPRVAGKHIEHAADVTGFDGGSETARKRPFPR